MQIDYIKHLIFRNIFGQATEGEKARLETWLAESAANRELYDKLRSTPFIEKAVTDDNGKLLGNVWKAVVRNTSLGRRNLRRMAIRIAAAVAIPLLAGGTLLTLSLLNRDRTSTTVTASLIRPGSPKVIVTLPGGEEMMFDENMQVSMQRDGKTVVNEGSTVSLSAEGYESGEDEYTIYKIPSGGEYTIKLDDGTIVTMNSDSELRAPVKFGRGQRTVYFKGEGYFEVAKDAGRQFVVETDHAAISVLGTEFNIRAYGDEGETVTTLVEGSVSVMGDTDRQVTMVPNTQARVSGNGNVVVEAVDVYPYIAWKSGRIVFENARTEDIMKVLRRWYNCDVYYADDAVKERRFTMDILKYDDITEVLNLMVKVNVHYSIKGNEVFLSSK